MKKNIKAACVQIRANDVSDYADAECRIIQGIVEACNMGAQLIVLPECAYPSYYIGNDPTSFSEAMDHFPEVAGAISSKASEYGVHIASGFLARENGILFNLGILWGPDGKEIGRVRKSNMWHFDSKYVDYGRDFDVWDTELGKTGMIICADGRTPEIIRILALKGAEIVLDMANLVTSSGKDPSRLSNPQVEYMLPVRARENGLWIMLADKVGMEAGTVLNTGQSCIIDPFGNIVSRASPDKEEIVRGEIHDVGRPDIPVRRSELYGALVTPNEKLPVTAMIAESLPLDEREIFGSVAHFPFSSISEYVNKAAYFTKILEDQGSQLVMLPSMANGMSIEYVQAKLQDVLCSDNVILALSGYEETGESRCAVLFTAERTLGRFWKSHGGDIAESRHLVPLKTFGGNLAVMFDEEGLVPEVARTFMLRGAESLLWFDAEGIEKAEMFCRSRASENRIYILRSGSGNIEDQGSITDPFGQIKAVSTPGKEHGVSALILRNLARSKVVVPGTDVVMGRRPEFYGDLLK